MCSVRGIKFFTSPCPQIPRVIKKTLKQIYVKQSKQKEGGEEEEEVEEWEGIPFGLVGGPP